MPLFKRTPKNIALGLLTIFIFASIVLALSLHFFFGDSLQHAAFEAILGSLIAILCGSTFGYINRRRASKPSKQP